jgi:hypothetical protein
MAVNGVFAVLFALGSFPAVLGDTLRLQGELVWSVIGS